MKISKELLSEVLKNKLPLNSKGFNLIKVNGNNIEYGIELSFKREINIYELVFEKCIEWLKNKGYMITIFIHLDTTAVELRKCGLLKYSSPAMSVYKPDEAVIEACQWILDNKDKQ